MISRRVFLKNGGLALVSLGFAPAFLARTVAAAGDGAPARADHDLPARRGRRPEHDRAVRRARVLRRTARIAIARPSSGPRGGARSRRLLRSPPAARAARATVRRAPPRRRPCCGSPDGTRSHFDAQDYMETRHARREEHAGRLVEPVSARRASTRRKRRFARSRSRRSCRARCRDAPALAIGQIDRFGIRAGQATEMVQSSFEAQYAAAADRVLHIDRARSVRRRPHAEAGRPDTLRPGERRRVSALAYGEALKQIAQLVKSDVGLEVAFAESGNWDHHVQRRGGARAARDAPGRLRPRHRRARTRSRRSHAGRRHPHDVGVRPGGRRERQPRDGSRPRQRHDGHRRRRARREGVRKMAGLAREQRYEGRDLAVTTDFRAVFNEVVHQTPGTHQHAGRVPRLHRTSTARPLLTREQAANLSWRTCREEPP